MDNSSYHSQHLEKIPTQSTWTVEIQDWLTAYGIVYPEHVIKCKLLALIHSSNPQVKYAVDEIAKGAGHEIVHIPLNSTDLRLTSLSIIYIR